MDRLRPPDGVDHGQDGDDRRGAGGHRIDDPTEDIRRGERPGGVVDEDDVVLTGGTQSGVDGLDAVGTADDGDDLDVGALSAASSASSRPRTSSISARARRNSSGAATTMVVATPEEMMASRLWASGVRPSTETKAFGSG